MAHALVGLVIASFGLGMIWWATHFRTAQAPWWLRLALVIVSAIGVLAALVGSRLAFAA